MSTPACQRIPDSRIHISGVMGDYLRAVTDQWLLVAPQANPAMLEMFRDRDAFPLRDMVAWAGEFAGKYLTSAVQVLRVTANPQLESRLKDFVQRLISFQDEDGYLGPWPRDSRLTGSAPNAGSGNQTWDAWGHYHVMLGLMLWHEETGDSEALAAVNRIADLFCYRFLGKREMRLVDTGESDKNLAPVHAFALLYRKTNNESYLKMAHQIVKEFAAQNDKGALAGDYLRQALQGKEFYETPKPRWESLHAIMGLAELYWISAENRYRQAFEHLWWSMVKLDRHNNGGFTSGERAQGNPYHMGAIESCCTIAWIAMSVEMLKMTMNSVIADEIELSTINSVVGMHSSSGSWATYNTPMNGVRQASAHAIVFQARAGSPELNCCSVNSPRGFGLISEWALTKDAEGLILNYYGPSELNALLDSNLWVNINQSTDYPADGRINLFINSSREIEFTLKLRIPHWSKKSSVKLNGKEVGDVEAGSYLPIRRKWKRDDHIQIDLDFTLHYWVGDRECEMLVSLYRGPVLLTYDHRYNLESAPHSYVWCDLPVDERHKQIQIPTLDANRLNYRAIVWESWLPPQLLFEFESVEGKAVRLCDFGSAGEGGTPYISWLSVKNVHKTGFSQTNPLRSSQIAAQGFMRNSA